MPAEEGVRLDADQGVLPSKEPRERTMQKRVASVARRGLASRST